MTRAQAQALRLVPPAGKASATRFCDRETCQVPRPHKHKPLPSRVPPPPPPCVVPPPIELPRPDPLADVYRRASWRVRDALARANGSDLAPVFAAVREGVRLVRREHPLTAPDDDDVIARAILQLAGK